MKHYNFIINSRLIEVIAEDLDQAEKMAKIIADQIVQEKEQE